MKGIYTPAAARVPLDLGSLEDIDVPQEVLNWPSMMSAAEIALLYRLAARHYSGRGEIVDAGIFLGASTNAFACGLAAGKRVPANAKPIRSYDLAIWVASMDRYLERPEVRNFIGCDRLADGASYAATLQRILAHHADVVDLVIGNIIRTARATGPVEIAFFDCLKAADRDLAAFNAFGPHFMPGHTLVLQQDYFYEGAADHKLRQELYADCYRFVGQVGSTAVFQVMHALPTEAFRRDVIPDLPICDRIALLRQAAGRADGPKGALLVELSLLEHLIDIGATDAAVEVRDHLGDRIRSADRSVVTRRPEQVFAGLSRRLDAVL